MITLLIKHGLTTENIARCNHQQALLRAMFQFDEAQDSEFHEAYGKKLLFLKDSIIDALPSY